MCRVCGQRIEECAACLHFICFSFAKEYGQNITVIKFLKTGEISIEICGGNELRLPLFFYFQKSGMNQHTQSVGAAWHRR